MMLHEDYEGIGAYLYELNDTLDPGLGAKIIAAMGLHVPVDLRPEIDEAVARGVVISRRDLISKLGRLEDRPEWSEATYLTVYHTEVSYTIETPKPFPIKTRVKAHIAAVETLMNALLQNSGSSIVLSNASETGNSSSFLLAARLGAT